MQTLSMKSNTVSHSAFCTLEYAPDSHHRLSTSVGAVIILVLHDANQALHFLIHPDIHKIVSSVDLPYFLSLLDDFIERVKQGTSELFEHLCSLAVGPLLTGTIGKQLCDHPDIDDATAQFLPLHLLPRPISG